MNYVLDQGKKFYQISLSILISCLLDNVPYNDVVEREVTNLSHLEVKGLKCFYYEK